MTTAKKTTVRGFTLQSTRSFDGAPQREEFESDAAFLLAIDRYQREWRDQYQRIGCTVSLCPQCDEVKFKSVGDGYTCQFCGETCPAGEWNKRGQACPKCGQPYSALLDQDTDE